MNESSPRAIAKLVRPLLLALADAVCLPTGILGVIFTGFDGKQKKHLLFAELVHPDRDVEDVDRSREAEESKRIVHYLLPEWHPLVESLLRPSQDAVALTRRAAQTSYGDAKADVWRPLVAMFGGDERVPDPIMIWRAWLLQARSLLYFLPQNQDDTHREWRELERIAFLAGFCIRSAVINVALAGKLESDNAAAILASLPEFLPVHEKELFELSRRAAQYDELARDVRLLIRCDRRRGIVMSMSRGQGIKARELAVLKPQRGANIQCVDAKSWVDGGNGPKGHKMVLFVLATRRAWADRQSRQSLAWVPWQHFWPFLIADNNDHAFVTDSLPQEGFQGEDQVASIDYGPQNEVIRRRRNLIHKRVMRGVKHLEKAAQLGASQTRALIEQRPLSKHADKAYRLDLTVDLDPTVIDICKEDNSWQSLLFRQVMGVEHSSPRDSD